MIPFWAKNSQIWASLIGGVSMFCSAAAYAWLAPLIDGLESNQSAIPMTSGDVSWVLIIYELGSLVAPLPVCYLADRWGRKPVLWVFGPCIIVTWIILALIKSKTCVYLIRFLQGIIAAVPYTVLPFYCAEISQPDLRGAVTSLYKITWRLGLLYTYITGAFTNYEGLTYFMIIPCLIFTGTFLKCPESPYFLLMKNRKQDASNALVWLRGSSTTDEEISRALNEIEEAVELDRNTSKGSWKDLIATKGSRKALLITQLIALIYIMTGTSVVAVYETNSVARISGSSLTANLVTIILGTLLFIVTIPSFFLTDRMGRRSLLSISCLGSGLALLAAAIILYLIEVQKLEWTSLQDTSYAACIIGLCFVTLGIEPILPILQSELFNSNTRAAVSGLTTINVTFLNVLCTKAYDIVQLKVGLYLMYLIFSVFSLAGFFIAYFFVPETKGKSLEEIQAMLT